MLKSSQSVSERTDHLDKDDTDAFHYYNAIYWW